MNATTYLDNLANVPDELKQRPQWLLWIVVERGGKATKVPVTCSYKPASSTDASTWSTFAHCLDTYRRGDFAGLGFVFTPDDPYFGLDLDDCVVGDALHESAQAIVDTFATYTEASPSGTGCKLFGKGTKPTPNCRTRGDWGGEVEIYDSGRFFAVTGRVLPASVRTVERCQEQLDGLCAQLWPPQAKPARKPSQPVSLDAAELLERIEKSEQSAKFRRLWDGDTSGYSTDSHSGHSEADLALCSMLAFWTGGDAGKVDSMFRQSGLMRDKWDQKRGAQTYGQLTVAKAVAGCTEFYTPANTSTWDIDTKTEADHGIRKLFDKIASGNWKNVPWKFSVLTRASRALLPGTLTILCGSPGATKSFFVIENLAYWHDSGIPCACLMLEDTHEYHLLRAIAQRVGESFLTDYEWVEEHRDEADAHRAKTQSWQRSFGRCIHTPPSDVIATHDNIVEWVRKAAEAGTRVIVVDPISIAASNEKAWLADASFVSRAKKIAEKYGCSLILVTHPSKRPDGETLDDVSGGAAFTRFAQCVLWLKFMPDIETKACKLDSGDIATLREINREMVIAKARNGPGQGQRVGFMFSTRSLTFSEQGLVVKYPAGRRQG